jgi:hypothetical protein
MRGVLGAVAATDGGTAAEAAFIAACSPGTAGTVATPAMGTASTVGSRMRTTTRRFRARAASSHVPAGVRAGAAGCVSP